MTDNKIIISRNGIFDKNKNIKDLNEGSKEVILPILSKNSQLEQISVHDDLKTKEDKSKDDEIVEIEEIIEEVNESETESLDSNVVKGKQEFQHT